ncbi:MAG: septum formation inhibitor Maf [Thiotrichaceae bacterium]|nr:septum formation inhibitor Maf [Thiotrichaceae bacterium]
MSITPKLVLASSSPYRRALLEKLQVDFITGSPKIDETPLPHETPQKLALRLCKLKAYALRKKYPKHLIIGSDQVAVLNDMQLHKPENRANSIKQLTLAAGREVNFFTAVGVLDSNSGQFFSDLDCCTATFRQLTGDQIKHYVDKEKPYDCAGAFKSEGLGIALFESIKGEDPNALIGLPLIKLITLLENCSFKII